MLSIYTGLCQSGTRDNFVLVTCPAGYAYTKMIEAAKAQRGELILVVLGPLTNVALACKLDPQLPSRGTWQMHQPST